MNAPVSNPSPVDFELSFNESPIDGYYFFSLSCAQKKVDRIWVAVGGTEQELELDNFGEWGLAFLSNSVEVSRPFLKVKALIGNSYYTCTKVLQGGGAGQTVLLLDGSTDANLVMEGASRSVSATGSANCQLEIYAGTKLADIRNTMGCTVTLRPAQLFSSKTLTIALIYNGQLNLQPQPTPNSKKSPPKIEATLKDRNGQQTPLRVFFSNEIMFGMPKVNHPYPIGEGNDIDQYIRYLPDDVPELTREHFKFFIDPEDNGLKIEARKAAIVVNGAELSAGNKTAWAQAGSLQISLDWNNQYRLELSEIVNMPGVLAFNATGVAQGKRSPLGMIIWCYTLTEQPLTVMGVRFKISSGVLSVLSNGNWFPLDKAIIDSCIEI
jgi:hypothetical protein